MAKNMQNELYKKKTSKQQSKSNLRYNEKLNYKTPENNPDYISNNNNQSISQSTLSTLTQQIKGDKVHLTNKKTENNNLNSNKNKNYFETKVKNNFTIRGYRKRSDNSINLNNKRKRNDNDFGMPNQNRNRSDIKSARYSNSEQYLEVGTYDDIMTKNSASGEQLYSEDDDARSVCSDFSDFCQREQYNVECYNYYLNFGDPYVMNNGEISVSENNWYYDRQPQFGRVFYYGNQMNETCYDGLNRFNYPNHQEFKFRNVEQCPFYPTRGMYMNNYVPNGYFNGYIEQPVPTMIPNEYPYQYPVNTQPEFVPDNRYVKQVVYEEPVEDVNSNNHFVQENDTLNVINLNSSLFVYNSNVHINTVHNEIHGTSATNNDPTTELSSNFVNTNNDTTAIEVSSTNVVNGDIKESNSENCY